MILNKFSKTTIKSWSHSYFSLAAFIRNCFRQNKKCFSTENAKKMEDLSVFSWSYVCRNWRQHPISDDDKRQLSNSRAEIQGNYKGLFPMHGLYTNTAICESRIFSAKGSVLVIKLWFSFINFSVIWTPNCWTLLCPKAQLLQFDHALC